VIVSSSPTPRSAQRTNVFRSNSEPGRRPTGSGLSPFGHGNQAFALGQLPSGLPRASDGFRLLARLAFRRFFIRPAALHLAKNALALQLLFKNPKGLIDIVVANEYLQNSSDLLLSLDARQAADGASRSAGFQILISGLELRVGFARYPIVDPGLRPKTVDMFNAAARPRKFALPGTAVFQTARLHRWLRRTISHSTSYAPIETNAS
jgi:hypothetical protein